MNAAGGERGQAAAEYVAALALVVAVMAVVIASPVGEQVRAAVSDYSCRVLSDGDVCGTATTVKPSPPPPKRWEPSAPCATSVSTKKLDANVSVTFVKVGGGYEFVRTEHADETVSITSKESGEAGGTAGVGAGAGLKAGGWGGGVGGRAEGDALLGASVGKTWNFVNGAQADAFTGKLKADLARRAIDTGNTGFALAQGPAGWARLAGEKVSEEVSELWAGESPDPLPPPKRTEFMGGLKLQGTGFAGGGTANASVTGLASKAVGGSTGPNGTTLRFESTKSLAFEASEGVTARGGSIAPKTTYELELDAKRRPVKLTVTGTQAVSGRINVSGAKNLSGLTRAISGRGGAGASATSTASYTAELGLRDETNQRAAVAFLGALAADPTAQGRPGLAGELLKRMDDDPRLSVRQYEGVGAEISAGAGAGVAAKVSGDAAFTEGTSTLREAKFYDPSAGWLDISNCKKR